MEGSYEIITMLERLGTRLDLIEDKLDRIADSTLELQTQGSLITEDIDEIKKDIDRLEPGVI